MIDKKGKLFGKISIIDFGILLLIIVFALGVFIKFGVLDQTTTSTTNAPITYTLKISEVRILYYEQLRVGDKIYENTDDTEVGTIKDVSYKDAEKSYVSLDGTMGMTSVEDRYDIYITIETKGAISSDRYLIDRTYEIGVGSSDYFHTKFVSFIGSVEEIDVDEQQ